MRILQVIPFFSPKMGGSAQVAYQTAAHLALRGHQVTVLASDFGTEQASFPPGPFQVVLFPNRFARSGFYFSPAMSGWLKKHIREFDLLHLHEVRTYQNILARRHAIRHRIPYLLSAHGTLPLIIERQFAKHLFDLFFGRRILWDARRLIAVSPFELQQYRHAGLPAERLSLVYNGLDLAEFAHLPAPGSFRQRFSGLPQAPLILFLGRLHPIKGIDHLIAAFAILAQQDAAPHLIIAGPDGGQLSHLQAQVARLGLAARVHFVGPLYGRDKLAAYRDAAVLVSPGIYEIFGLVPFEALLCGTPVIVSQDSGTGQLIGEARAGYLVPYGDQPSLVAALQRVLSSPEEGKRLVANGQRFIHQNLSWDTIAAHLEMLYATQVNGETA